MTGSVPIPVALPAVWVYTTTAGMNTLRAAGYGAFLDPAQKARLERVRQARMLFDGRHREYYLDERRSQYDFSPMRAQETVIQPYIKYNLLRKCCQKITDLLLGAEPIMRIGDKIQRQRITEINERVGLHQLFYSKALDASYEAEALVEAVRFNGQVYLKDAPTDEYFPVGDLQPNGQYAQYDRFTLQNIGSDQQKLMLLLKQSYFAGRIERHVYQLTEEGQIMREVKLDYWRTPGKAAAPAAQLTPGESPGANVDVDTVAGMYPDAYGELTPGDSPGANDGADDSAPLQAVTFTGIDENTITWIPNELMRGCPISDLDGAIELQDTLNAKMTQLARVIAKHADPKMAFPARSADDQGAMRAGMDAFFYMTPDEIPRYLTWNPELASALEDRNFAVSSLLAEMETSPLLLGMRQQGSHAEAFKTVKVQSYVSITKAGRKAPFWKTGIARCLRVAQKLEQGNGTRYNIAPVPLEMRDGLPTDSKDQAEELSVLRAAGILSVHGALMQLNDGDEGAVAAEEAELAKEDAAKTPSIFLGEGMAGGKLNSQPNAQSDEAAAAAAAKDLDEVGE